MNVFQYTNVHTVFVKSKITLASLRLITQKLTYWERIKLQWVYK